MLTLEALPLRVKGFPPRSDLGAPGEVLLVDFVDDGDARVREDVRRRVQEYRRAGFMVITAPGPTG